MTIYFEDNPVTFKECYGYDISLRRFGDSSEIAYEIEKNNNEILSGITTMYNYYDVYHNVLDDLIDEESIQKTRQ